jgi:hypothetical protein
VLRQAVHLLVVLAVQAEQVRLLAELRLQAQPVMAAAQQAVQALQAEHLAAAVQRLVAQVLQVEIAVTYSQVTEAVVLMHQADRAATAATQFSTAVAVALVPTASKLAAKQSELKE